MDNNLNDVYNDVIMEHSMNSYNKRKIDMPDFSKLGHNPSCGDEINLEVKLNKEKNIIEDMAFLGHGCAISQASTSVMIDTLIGKSPNEAKEVINTFLKMIKREVKDESDLEVLEEAIAFKNISNMPARVKCAVLAWHTLENILNENNNDIEGKV